MLPTWVIDLLGSRKQTYINLHKHVYLTDKVNSQNECTFYPFNNPSFLIKLDRIPIYIWCNCKMIV